MILSFHDGTDVYMEATYNLIDGNSIVLGSFVTGENLQINIYNEYRDE